MSVYLRFLAVLLVVFWLLMSGFWYKSLILTLGALSVILVLYLAWRIERQYSLETLGKVLFRLPTYWSWLLVEIVKTNLDVVKCIWFPKKYPISPTLAELPMSQKSRMGKTIYANSITLTPGTVSIKIIPNSQVLVHGLTREAVEDLKTGAMDQRVTQMELGRTEQKTQNKKENKP